MSKLGDGIKLRVMRRLRAAVVQTHAEEVQFRTGAGYRIAATLTKPQSDEPLAGVVLCPGSDHDRSAFAGIEPIRPEEIAGLGCAVLSFDPPGRGTSWGPEDFGGAQHQDAAASAVRWLRERPGVRANGVGLLGLSLGIAAATGAARALAEGNLPAAWLLDWEGPSDRRVITANGTILEPAMGHKNTDDTYWRPREAVHHVGSIRCPYWRLQADPDHAQPGETQHAADMMSAASQLGWYRLNFHAAGHMPAQPTWLKGGRYSSNRALLQALGELTRGR